MIEPIELGRHRKTPLGAVADKAARSIVRSGAASAVTMDPDGRWWLERPGEVAEVDLIGVYRGDQAFSLARDIHADLKHELALRAAA